MTAMCGSIWLPIWLRVEAQKQVESSIPFSMERALTCRTLPPIEAGIELFLFPTNGQSE